jgi:acetoin utilization deacetylase AcuC-like enzyme
MTDRVLLVTHAGMDRHAAHGHPERPARRGAVATGVRDAAGERLVVEEARAADPEELRRIHPDDHLASLDALEAAGSSWPDPDTYVVAGSSSAARLAAGGTIDAARAVARGTAAVGFAVVRPPGHHMAERRPTGFCLLNNVALAVAALRAEDGLRRIAIVDWDVHHGDGTQAIFDTDPDTWYASTHQWPLFPGTGRREDDGLGAARGTKQNRPLPPGSGDAAFVAAWRDDLLPGIAAFAPEAILVSAGYDAHRDDPLADLAVTEAGYEAVAAALGGVAARLGLPGVALTLEGGYDLDAIRASAAGTVRGLLAGLAPPRVGD